MARSLRRAVCSQVEDALVPRGYEPVGRGIGRSTERPLADPLVGVITPVVEGHRYGGAALSGLAEVRSPVTAEFCRDVVPDEAWAAAARPEDLDGYFLSVATFGSLMGRGHSIDFQWQIEDGAGIAAAVAEFDAVVEGPATAWLEDRVDPEKLLAAILGQDPRTSGFWGRTGAVLAAQCGRWRDAQSLLELMADSDRLNADGRARLSAFADTLTKAFPNV